MVMKLDDWLSFLYNIVFAYYSIKILYHIILHTYVYFFAPPKNLQKLARSNWAAVTGATDGIGKGYVTELAKRGFNVILISRNPQKLDDVKYSMRLDFPNVQFETISFDFSTTSVDEYKRVFGDKLHKIGLLVNNVGCSYTVPDKFHLISGTEVKNMVNINMFSTMIMCKLVLKQMEERGSGIIVNVGSASESLNFAYYSAYCGIKRGLRRFSDSLRVEYPMLTIQYTMPGWVATNLSKTNALSVTVRTAEEYSEAAVKTIGYCHTTRGFWSHQLQFDILESLPCFITDPLFELILRMKNLSLSLFRFYLDMRRRNDVRFRRVRNRALEMQVRRQFEAMGVARRVQEAADLANLDENQSRWRSAHRLPLRLLRYAANQITHIRRLISRKQVSLPESRSLSDASATDSEVSYDSRQSGHEPWPMSSIIGEHMTKRVRHVIEQPPLDDKTVDEHSWNPEDCSGNLFFENDTRTVHRHPVAQSTDAIRGKQGYSRGTHIWSIHWPKKQRGTHAVIGVCTKEQPLQANGYCNLIGGSEHSFGYDIVRQKCVHDEKNFPPWDYPQAKARFDHIYPETLYCILDMEDGSLAFASDRHYFGIAFKNLKGLTLFPAVSAVWGFCQVSIAYMGSVHKPHTLQELCCHKIRSRLEDPCAFVQSVSTLGLSPAVERLLRGTFALNTAFLNLRNRTLRKRNRMEAQRLGLIVMPPSQILLEPSEQDDQTDSEPDEVQNPEHQQKDSEHNEERRHYNEERHYDAQNPYSF
ncbi:unnamed protein product [Bursaphelenchus okinawaensis]|uniref:B30.2/SPRY domain-containing protein n=1 Tax=Bursaphelenchus okinawaensis TaxID=465554 RepID=A0A811KA21_9BILA|nr:unnamed protein product [Bursaphelenchus okinawaensis]CAG9096799.1 unnamed protein product [Bursaphelenchus okinawaensis]